MTLFAYIATVLIWGSTWYAIELQLGQVSPFWSVSYRFFFSAILLLLACYIVKKSLKFSRREHMGMVILGFFLFSSNYILVYIGTEYLTSGLVAVCFSTMTFFNILFSRIFFKNPIEKTVLGGALIGKFGILLIFWPEIQVLSFADATTLGLAICIISTIFASLGNITATAPTLRAVPLMPLTAWAMLYGSIISAIVAVIAGHEPTLDTRVSYWVSFLYLTIIGSIIAFTLYLWLIEKLGVTRASYNVLLIPIVALVISTFMEGYVWTPASITGVALVLGGNLTLIRRRAKAEVQKAT